MAGAESEEQRRFFFSSRRRHTRWPHDWSSDECSSDLGHGVVADLVRKLARDPKHLEILGADPGTAKSYVHIEDVLAGISVGVRAADQPVAVYNLGTEDAITVRSLADAICDELGLVDVEDRWTGGSGGGRGRAADVRVTQVAT